MSEIATFTAGDGLVRCRWCDTPGFAQYLQYHDEEWGFPVTDDRRLFEKICLEGFQAGLSWRTILSKREAFRAAFADFDFRRICAFGPSDVERLLQDAGIVRHRGKIEAVLNNARQVQVQALVDEFGSLSAYFWRFCPDIDAPLPVLRSESEASRALSKDLRRRGWKFVGPTTMYAFMQAMGMVNDHASGCHVRERAQAQRRAIRSGMGLSGAEAS
ncbi:MAG: DNA-3-methyladenine glycosylase I [Burkholderiaceae bacterium]|nr:DNA-3-methyladenine glycosylase I [Roseateles sp.]MBV8470310.1 DNA-3-methyladenine glycosylase I [Burkholderiaceae bacterium]